MTLREAPVEEFLPQPDLPLSSLQLAILSDEARGREQGRYNVPLAYSIEGALDEAALALALRGLVDRHEVLRTVYPMQADGPIQSIAARAPTLLERGDAEGRDAAQLIAADSDHVFDLERDLPLRCVLYRLGENWHVLTLVFHHVAVDGGSIRILLDELSRLYAEAAGAPAALPAAPDLQYADWAAWQDETRSEPGIARAVADAARRLDGLIPALGWASSGTRSPAALDFMLDRHEVAGLEEAARARGTTLYGLLATAFTLLLARLSGQRAIAFGAPVTLRDRAEIEAVVGCFVNTVPVRLDLEDDTTLAALTEQARLAIVEAIDGRQAPFEAVVAAWREARAAADAPALGAFFNFDDAPLAPPELSGCRVEPVVLSRGTAKFPLMLSMVRWGDEIRGAFDFDAALFATDDAAFWPNGFRNILDALQREPDRCVRDVGLVDEATRRRLLEAATGALADRPETTLDRLLAARAGAWPDRPALIQGEAQVSFAELLALSDGLADLLRARGLSRGARVAIVLPRELGLIPAMLGALTAGACYLPLDPDQPSSRLADLLQDAEPGAIVTDAAGLSALEAARPDGVPVLLWHGSGFRDPEPAKAVRPAPPQAAGPDDPAYMIFTSGSTGRPKAVVMPHRGVLNYLLWAEDYYPSDPAAGAPVVTATAFDATVLSFWAPLLAGRPVELLPEEDTTGHLAGRLSDGAGYGFVKLTPAQLDLLADLAPPSSQTGGTAAFVIGGEALTPAALAPWCHQTPGVRLINEYGPTETAVGCCIHDVRAADLEARSVPIGRPIANARLYVLDTELNLLPPGVVGELFIGGAGVAHGYWRRPGLTAERFLADPFAPEPGARMYRTGDLVCLHADERFTYHGRVDDQVKIQGHRIEPGEVEAALRAIDGVEQGAVIAAGDGLERRLVAFIAGTADPASCRSLLGQQLPAFMVPAEITALDALPLTDNGKIDRRRLPALIAAAAADTDEPPESDTPHPLLDTVIAAWSAILGRDDIAPDSNFFDSGGKSLTAIQLIARLRRQLGPDIPLDVVHRAPTPGGMARLLSERQGQAAAPEPEAPEPAAADATPRPSPGEHQLWLESLLRGGGRGYAMQGALRISLCDAAMLHRAARAVADRHSALRTRYLSDGDGLTIQVDETFEPDVQIDDVSGTADPEASARTRILQDVEIPFDLAAAPPWRLRLTRLSETGAVLALTIHHIISDAASLEIVLGDLAAELADTPRLSPQRSYRQFAAARDRRVEAVSADCIGYWRDHLREAPADLELPTDRPRFARSAPGGAAVALKLPAPAIEVAEAAARRSGATLHAVFCAAYALLLRRLTGSGDCVIGIPVSERPEGHERVVGNHLNTLPLRLRLDRIAADEAGGRRAIGLAAESMLGLLAHADVSLTGLLQALNPPRRPGRPPLFQTVLDWNDAPVSEARHAETFPLDVPLAPFDLALTLRRLPDGGVQAGFVFDDTLLDRGTVAAWARSFRRLVAALAEDRPLPLDRLPALEPEDEARVAPVGAPAFAETSIAALLRDCFARHADATAVEDSSGSMSYAGLAEAARAAMRPTGAPALRRITSEKGTERIVEAVAALLSGQAFLLEDPAIPAARRASMRDAAAHWADPAPPVDAVPDAPAYVQFTSGSTGRQKGAVVSRRGLANVAQAMAVELQIEPGARVLQAAAPAFDAWMWEVFTTLAGGGTLVVRPRDEVVPGPVLADTLRRAEISHVTLTPSALAALDRADLPGLRVLVAAGESLNADLVRHWAPGRRFLNAYGPCECAICATVYPCTGGEEAPAIGTPIAGVELMVVGKDGALALPGCEGELWIAGAGLGLGYLGAPETTAERFVAHPGRADRRAYRTGDVVRVRADGAIQFVGRDDRQVKIRGVRIELDEIEARLSAQPGISLAAARQVEDAEGRPALAAWISGPKAVDPAAVRDALARELPEAMLPAFLVPVAQMPLTATGKIDRAALPDPRSRPVETADGTRAATGLEATIAAAFRDVLALDREPGPEESFFVLGGHSLLAVRLAGLLARRLERELPLALLFAHPTPGALARAIDEGQGASDVQVRVLREGDGPEAILLHPVGGSGACYQALADAWPGTRRVAALEQTRRFASLDEMAARYAEVLLARGGSEPLLLAGWSFGALIAARMADGLRRAGHDVRLVLMDAAPVSEEDPESIERELERAAREGTIDDDTLARMRANIAITDENADTRRRGPAGIIRARNGRRDAPDDLGWSGIFERVEVREAVGSHATMLDEAPDRLARTIEELWREGGGDDPV